MEKLKWKLSDESDWSDMSDMSDWSDWSDRPGEAVDGALENPGDIESLGIRGLGQQLTVVPRHAANGTNREGRTAILDKIAPEESLEIVDDKCSHLWNMQMAVDKARGGGQVTVG